jgi:uncharacterized membrane protein
MADKAGQQSRTIFERHFWLFVLLILAVGLLFRLPGIGSRSLWIDELYTEWFSSRSFPVLWHEVPSYETHPPTYYTLLKLWRMLFGNSELGLRSLSLLASLATILAIAISGRLTRAGWVGEGVSLLGAAFVAVSYASIREAQNARPYALQMFVATVTVVAAIVLIERLKQTRTFSPVNGWIGPALILGAAGGTALWLHNTSFFIDMGVWSGLMLSLVFTPAEQRLRNFVIFCAAGVLALVVFAPYAPLFLLQSRAFSGLAFWLEPAPRDLYSAWFLFLGSNWPAFILSLALLALGLYRLAKGAPAQAMLAAAILVLPLYAMLAVHFWVKPVYIQRLFAWAIPLGFLVIACGILSVTRAIWPRLVLAIAVFAFLIPTAVLDFGKPIDDWKSLMAIIARDAQPGDVVIATPAEGIIAVDYYAKRQAHFPPVVCIPGCYPQRNLPRVYGSNLGAPKIIPADAALVDDALKGHGRVWLVQVSVALYDPAGIIKNRILESRKFVRYFGNSLAKVELYDMPAAVTSPAKE